jgi:arylsulfatase A-like enzyme/tetratricopeptide (TPR) repeat protein
MLRGRGVRRDPGLSILLISIDTLRADALGAYGRPGADTPWADRLAQGGVRFDNAHAHNVVTLPSHANLLSGQLPTVHGLRDNSGFRFPQDLPTLATILKGRGYRTGAFVSAFPLDSRFGLDVGFDVYDDQLRGAETYTAFTMPERRGAVAVEAARRWITADAARPYFCFVHLYEPHFPYTPPEPQASRFRDAPYQGEVAAADAALGPLLEPILAEGRGGRTLVVLTADHGEALGDHGEETHGIFAYEATLRVPLILYAPRLLDPAVAPAPARHVDVFPTVLDALGAEIPPGLPGRSLLEVREGGRAEAPPTYFEALSTSLNRGWAPLHGVLAGTLKYIDLPIPELYDLAADPGEERNLATTHSEPVERLRRVLEGLREKDRGVSRVREDASAAERLRALGYLSEQSAPAKPSYAEGDDPKRLLELDQRDAEVLRLYYAGDYDRAIALCRRNIEQRPEMSLSHMQLAYLERARGDLPAAIAAARRAVALRPRAGEAAAVLAVYLTEARRPAEALEALKPYLDSDPLEIDVLTAQGTALAALGRRSEALASFDRARAADPSNAMTLVNVATVHLMAGERGPAREAFEAALALDPGVARAYNGLGVIAAQEGRSDEAVERWKSAVALNPGDYQTLFNLGVTLRRLGREAEARPYLRSYLETAPKALESRDLARVRAWLGEG